MFLDVSDMQMNDKEKDIKKNKLRNLVISGQYILKDMKRFVEAKKLEPKKMMMQIIKLS